MKFINEEIKNKLERIFFPKIYTRNGTDAINRIFINTSGP